MIIILQIYLRMVLIRYRNYIQLTKTPIKHTKKFLLLQKILLRDYVVAFIANLAFHLFEIKTNKLFLEKSPYNQQP